MTNKAPKISVITPSYNQGVFLEETICSVFDQDYPNLEYIIIDGGSTDESVNIIQKYKERLFYWISEADHGQTDALNKGFRIATGEILCWINSDDLLCPGSLQYVADHFANHPSSLWCTGLCALINSEGVQQKEIAVDTDLSSALWLMHMKYNRAAILQPSTFWRSEVLQRVGLLREDLHYAFDFEFFYRIRKEYGTPVQLNRCFSKFRFHEHSKSVSHEELFLIEMIDIVRHEMEYLDEAGKCEVRAWLFSERSRECFIQQQRALQQNNILNHWKWRLLGWKHKLARSLRGKAT